MRIAQHSYLFGRLNLIGVTGDKKDFIVGGVSSTVVIEAPPYNWSFYDVEEFTSPIEDLPGTFVVGNLVKYRPDSKGEAADTETHKTKSVLIPNEVAGKAPFYLHIETGMIAYRPIAGPIYANTFRNKFALLFEAAYDSLLLDAEIQSIDQEASFVVALGRLTEVKRFTSSLHPSNPRNRDRWERVDQRLQRLQAVRVEEDYKLKPGAPASNLVHDPDIEAKVSMAEDGYGEASASGKEGSKEVYISTSKHPVTAKVASNLDSKPAILRILGDGFSRISERFKK